MHTQTTEKETAPKSLLREIMEWGGAIVCAVALAFLVRHFVFAPFIVDGHSMDNTLADHEVMLTTKYDYHLGNPERFDVVICHYPGRKGDFVKRVVGIPGDTVAVRGGYLYVNDQRVEEAYITHRPDYEMRPYTVGEGEYFVLGDNRSNSNDSHIVGPITRAQIIAHVRSVLLPLGKMRGIE